MKTSFTILKSSRRFRAGFAGLALSVFAALGIAQNAYAAPTGQSNNQTSACRTSPAHSSPSPAQPDQVTVVNPVTVTGTVETLNDALKIPVHLMLASSIANDNFGGEFYKVPSGMRLTIESVSAQMIVPSGQKVVAELNFWGGNVIVLSENLALQPQGSFNGVDFLVMSQNLKIIVDSTTPRITYGIRRNANDSEINYRLVVTGYLEAAP